MCCESLYFKNVAFGYEKKIFRSEGPAKIIILLRFCPKKYISAPTKNPSPPEYQMDRALKITDVYSDYLNVIHYPLFWLYMLLQNIRVLHSGKLYSDCFNSGLFGRLQPIAKLLDTVFRKEPASQLTSMPYTMIRTTGLILKSLILTGTVNRRKIGSPAQRHERHWTWTQNLYYFQ